MRCKWVIADLTAICLLAGLPTIALSDPLPKGFTRHQFNAAKPVTKSGVTTFQIHDRQCSKVDYGDGRGESDCYNGNVRSTLLYSPDARLKQTVEYRFDVLVDPSISYAGFYNDHAIGYLKDGHDSRLRIASWEGPYLHNFLYLLKLDRQAGITFLGKECQPSNRFGEWVSFSMKIRWAADKQGWISVSCDGEVIYSRNDIATNQAPHCYITNQCEPGKRKSPTRFIYIVGPVMAGFGHEWKKYGLASQFTRIQPEGIMVKLRNLSVSRTK